MAFELNGKLIEIYEPMQVSDKFRKREFVVEKEENANGRVFSEVIKFQLTQDRCNLLDNLHINDTVKVSFNIKGRRWEKDGKVSYFTNLEAWRLEKADGGQLENAPMPREEFVPDPQPKDDLPF